MQVSGVLSGHFYSERPFSEVFPISSYQSEAIQKDDSLIRLEEVEPNSKHASFKSRVVGIVNRSDLTKQPDGNYLINKRLYEKFNNPHAIKNLPKGFAAQYLLPFGTGVALSEDLILTAGHNVQISSEKICVVQYELEGTQLSQTLVYEVEKYVHSQFKSDGDQENNDAEVYAKNLLAGDWAIIKLKKGLRHVSGALKVAEQITDDEYKNGAETTTLGHPLGLPLKRSLGKVEKVLNKHIVRYEAQTLRGMSGGPVFSNKTDKLIGLHIRGNIDHRFSNLGELFFAVIYPENQKIIEMGIYGTFFQSIVPIIEKVTQLSLNHAQNPAPKLKKSRNERKDRSDVGGKLPILNPSVSRISQAPQVERMDNQKLVPTTTATIKSPLMPDESPIVHHSYSKIEEPEPSCLSKCCSLVDSCFSKCCTVCYNCKEKMSDCCNYLCDKCISFVCCCGNDPCYQRVLDASCCRESRIDCVDFSAKKLCAGSFENICGINGKDNCTLCLWISCCCPGLCDVNNY